MSSPTEAPTTVAVITPPPAVAVVSPPAAVAAVSPPPAETAVKPEKEKAQETIAKVEATQNEAIKKVDASDLTAKDFFALGETAFDENEYQKAYDNFKRSRQLDSASLPAWFFEINSLKKLNRDGDAKDLAKELVQKRPELAGLPAIKNLLAPTTQVAEAPSAEKSVPQAVAIVPPAPKVESAQVEVPSVKKVVPQEVAIAPTAPKVEVPPVEKVVPQEVAVAPTVPKIETPPDGKSLPQPVALAPSALKVESPPDEKTTSPPVAVAPPAAKIETPPDEKPAARTVAENAPPPTEEKKTLEPVKSPVAETAQPEETGKTDTSGFSAQDFFTLGETAFEEKNYQKAYDSFKQSRQLNPDSLPAWFYELDSLKKLSRSADAKNTAKELITRRPAMVNNPTIKNVLNQ